MNIILGSYSDSIGYLEWTEGEYTKKLFPSNPNPSWLYWDAQRQLLFAVEEAPQYGKLHSYYLDIKEKHLSHISSIETNGGYPCHIMSIPEYRELWISNYMGGPIRSFQYSKRGELSARIELAHQFEGNPQARNQANPERQEMSHPHSCILSPDRQGIYCTDLGYDYIVYHSREDAQVVVNETPSGYGPRHMCLSSDGNYLYVLCELQPYVLSYKILPNGSSGSWSSWGPLEYQQQCSITRQNKLSQGSEICHHPNLPYLYIANRNAGYVAQIKIQKDGKLEFTEEFPLASTNPRHIAISPDGNYLFTALQDSDQIQVFRVHANNGALDSYRKVSFEKPAFIGFI